MNCSPLMGLRSGAFPFYQRKWHPLYSCQDARNRKWGNDWHALKSYLMRQANHPQIWVLYYFCTTVMHTGTQCWDKQESCFRFHGASRAPAGGSEAVHIPRAAFTVWTHVDLCLLKQFPRSIMASYEEQCRATQGRATWESARVGQEALGVRGNVGRSLCCGFCGKEQVWQGKQV